jgi:SAM-dependent methyltransferase
LDAVNFADKNQNLATFDAIVELFRTKAPIPSSGVHSLRFPDLPSYEFPGFLDFEPDAAFERRAAAIRLDIERDTSEFVQSAAPWTDSSIIESNSLDWIFSQSVLEHVDDLENLYCLIGHWLKPGGYASHLIDFGSHGMTAEWNGHWALNNLAWRALRGKRPYLINRIPYAGHARFSAGNGLVTVLEKTNKQFDGLIPAQFAEPFKSMSDEDARTRMVLLISRRAPPQ